MKANFQGQLEEGMLVNLLQYLAMNAASGVLKVKEYSGASAELYFQRGRLIHAKHDGAQGIKALAPLLQWRSGLFSFRTDIPSPAATIDMPLDSLLLQAAYKADVQLQANGESHISKETVLAPAAVTSKRATVSLSLKSLNLLSRFDGRTPLSAIAERLDQPVGDLLEVARDLHRQGLLTINSSPSVPPEFLEALTHLTRDIIGPVADIVVEDTLFDLGLTPENVPSGAVKEVIEGVSRQFHRQDWRRRFETRARTLCAHYRVGQP